MLTGLNDNNGSLRSCRNAKMEERAFSHNYLKLNSFPTTWMIHPIESTLSISHHAPSCV
jgi:hypothetical protein